MDFIKKSNNSLKIDYRCLISTDLPRGIINGHSFPMTFLKYSFFSIAFPFEKELIKYPGTSRSALLYHCDQFTHELGFPLKKLPRLEEAIKTALRNAITHERYAEEEIINTPEISLAWNQEKMTIRACGNFSAIRLPYEIIKKYRSHADESEKR